MIKFDIENNVQDFTFVLSLRDHTHLGQIRNIDPAETRSKINMNGANEISFTVYKYNESELARLTAKLGEEKALLAAKEPLWDEITDFKYIYVKDIDEYYEITVDKSDGETLYKTVTGTSACETELSQSYVYNLEINTELDIARDDYVSPTVFYNESHPECSLLHRVLYKLPQYSIAYVDGSLKDIQRTFSFNGEDVCSVLTQSIAEEIGCLFIFNTVDRSISVYDLMTYCKDCGKRGEFSDVCPKCESTNLQYYGEDTTVYIDSENLASNVNLTIDTESVKNCFRLEAGDENMTAAVVNLNPNGSSYIYYFSEEAKHDMPEDLVNKMNSYDELTELRRPKYEEATANMYNAIDKIVYYTSTMMPTKVDDPTNAALEVAKLTESAMSPMGMAEVKKTTSTSTVNTALKEYAKVFIKSGYFKVEINNGEFNYVETDKDDGYSYGYWDGSFKVTNYSNEEDVAISEEMRIKVYDDFEAFLDQKIKKKLSLDSEEEGSIFDVLSIEDLSEFKEALKLYSLNRLTSFYDSIQGCLDIMIEMNQGKKDDVYNDLYVNLYDEYYSPYYEKLLACQSEIDSRQKTIDEWTNTLEEANKQRSKIQKELDFEAYLGKDLYKVFCMYKREGDYSNSNYISDGLDNDEIFERAKQFFEAAETEMIKAGTYQHQITSSLSNLLFMREFKPIKDKFQVGNFIRVGIDGKVYRLRLVSYEISFGEIQNINVEFSDVTTVRDGTSDLKSILSKANSMASSYGYVTHQVEKSKKETDKVLNWSNWGLDATAIKIVNDANNENIIMTNSGLLARKKEEFGENYEDYQLKLLSSGLYLTTDAWKSTDVAIGKSYINDPETKTASTIFGVNARAIVGDLILGKQLSITSNNSGAEMKFNDDGLVLNVTKDNNGAYKKIFDIQKDGKSQLYIDVDGNIHFSVIKDGVVTEIINSNGINADGIPSGTIVDDMVSDKAKIKASKILFESSSGNMSVQDALSNYVAKTPKISRSVQNHNVKYADTVEEDGVKITYITMEYSYNEDTDVIDVYVNGFRLRKSREYKINNGKIAFDPYLDSGADVQIVVNKIKY